MTNFKSLFNYIGLHHNPNYEYGNRLSGDYTVTGVKFEYLNIGNNVEFDTLGVIMDELKMFMWVHIRDADQVSTSFLADMLSQIRSWIIERMSMVTDYEELMKEIPEQFVVNIGGVLIDPGFNGHMTDEARDSGVTLSTFQIHNRHLFHFNIDEYLAKEIKLKKLIYSPEEYYTTLTLPKDTVEELNSLLAQASAQKNTPKRMRILLNQTLKKGGKFVVTFPEVMDVPVRWSYDSEFTPPLSFNLEHMRFFNGVVRAYWGNARLRPDGVFVLQVDKKFTEYFDNETDHNKFVENIISMSKKNIDELLQKHNIYIHPDSRKWRVDFI